MAETRWGAGEGGTSGAGKNGNRFYPPPTSFIGKNEKTATSGKGAVISPGEFRLSDFTTPRAIILKEIGPSDVFPHPISLRDIGPSGVLRFSSQWCLKKSVRLVYYVLYPILDGGCD